MSSKIKCKQKKRVKRIKKELLTTSISIYKTK